MAKTFGTEEKRWKKKKGKMNCLHSLSKRLSHDLQTLCLVRNGSNCHAMRAKKTRALKLCDLVLKAM